MIRPEHLAYFKDLFEGRANISWNAWFRQNEHQLSQDLPRTAFLKLKFHKLDEAEKLLEEAGMPFTISPHAKREKHYSLLHDSVLDDKGRPTKEFRRKAYNGAFGQILDGFVDKGTKTLAAFLKKMNRLPILKRMDELNDFCFDGENEFEFGERKIGRIMLELVAKLETGNDLLDPAILRARELLASQ
jgi:hypothetical protein